MLKDYTEIGVILDCSGSMQSIKSSIIKGYNAFIQDQKEIPGKCVVTLTTFSDSVHIHDSRPLSEVSIMTNDSYKPNGMTALWKAISDTMDYLGNRFSSMKESERPEKVLIVIITDGEENASNSYVSKFHFQQFGAWTQPSSNHIHFVHNKVYSLEDINTKISHQKKIYSWEFLFIGTETLNVSNIAVSMGISNHLSFSQSDTGTSDMYATMSSMTKGYRTTGNL